MQLHPGNYRHATTSRQLYADNYVFMSSPRLVSAPQREVIFQMGTSCTGWWLWAGLPLSCWLTLRCSNTSCFLWRPTCGCWTTTGGLCDLMFRPLPPCYMSTPLLLYCLAHCTINLKLHTVIFYCQFFYFLFMAFTIAPPIKANSLCVL